MAESLGVPRSAIITLDSPKDTEEEAAAVKQAIGDVPFLLVTSASHLPRAMIFFENKDCTRFPRRRTRWPSTPAQPMGTGDPVPNVVDA